MEQTIEQVLARLQALTPEARAHSPLYQAVASALAASPEDAADWQRFAANAGRYESAARDILKQRLASDAALLQRLRDLLGQSTSAPSSRHTANVSGKAKIGNLIVGDLNGNLNVGPMDFSDNKRVITAPPRRATPERTQSASTRPPLPTTLSADGTHFSYGHALLIGVGSYKQTYFTAPATATDAERLESLLTSATVASYPATQVTRLSGGSATRQGILDALDTFAQRLAAAPQATALLFFAGHGLQRDEGFYLMPYDYEHPYARETAISAALFQEKVAAIRKHAQKLVVLLNCCHSGGVGDSVLDDSAAGEHTSTPPTSFIEQLAEGSGHVVISAAKAAEKAGAISTVEPTLTVFGAQLVAALTGGAPGNGAGIGIFDLFAFLSANVPQDAKGIPYGGKPLAQHPLFYAHQVDQNFPLALRPGWQGGTLGDDFGAQVQELAEREIQLARYGSEADAPVELVQRRDLLLQCLSSPDLV